MVLNGVTRRRPFPLLAEAVPPRLDPSAGGGCDDNVTQANAGVGHCGGAIPDTSRLQKPAGAAWLASMAADTNETQDQPAEAPHYHGHRERLRERFHNAGPDALSDYELLEMALFPALPRRDTKPLAKALLKKFGSFAEVVHAPETRLREIKGIGDASINQLKLIAAAASRVRQRPVAATHVAVVMERRDRLLPHHDGVRRQGAVPPAVPRQAQPADRGRGAADRHRRPHPGLSARGDQARAGIVRHRDLSWCTTTPPAIRRRRRPTSR